MFLFSFLQIYKFYFKKQNLFKTNFNLILQFNGKHPCIGILCPLPTNNLESILRWNNIVKNLSCLIIIFLNPSLYLFGNVGNGEMLFIFKFTILCKFFKLVIQTLFSMYSTSAVISLISFILFFFF